jgi:hypothetical protein
MNLLRRGSKTKSGDARRPHYMTTRSVIRRKHLEPWQLPQDMVRSGICKVDPRTVARAFSALLCIFVRALGDCP